MKVPPLTIAWVGLLLLCCSQIAAQPDAVAMLRIHGPSQVGIVDSKAVDLNQDGLLDVVSLSIDDGELRAYLNLGNLQFEQQLISQDLLGGYRLTITDLNQDGLVDFLVPSLVTHDIKALIQEDTGFRLQTVASQVLLPTDALAADMNGDGLVDVVSTSFQDNALLLHRQTMVGDFTTAVIDRKLQQPRKAMLADINNNGLTDILVVTAQDGSLWLYENQGNAQFNATQLNGQLTGAIYLAACDQGDDAWLDFVVSAPEINSVFLFNNNNGSSFTPMLLSDNLPGVGAVHCADIDGESGPELLALATESATIHAVDLEPPYEQRVIANSRDGYISLHGGDFLNSGQFQVLTQTFFGQRNLLYEPDATNMEFVVWQEFPDGAYFIEVMDLDADGDQDLVYTAFRSDTIHWAEKLTHGYHIHDVSTAVDGPQSVALGDLDHDGDIDIVSAGAWDDTFWLHRNDGQQTFVTTPIFSGANNAARVAMADFNGDGLLDLVGTSGLDDSVRMFWNLGQANFVSQLVDDQADGALAVTAADVDADGDVDLVVGNFFGNDVSLYDNDGTGQMTKQTLATNKIKPTQVLVRDLDGNGHQDVLFNASSQGSIWWLPNHQGAWGTEQLITDQVFNIQDLVVTDFNADELPDLVAVSPNVTTLKGLLNSGNNAFNPVDFLVGLFGARSLRVLPDTSPGLPVFISASNSDNAIKKHTLVDLIFHNQFE